MLHKAQYSEDSQGGREFLSGQVSALLMPITTDIVNSRHCRHCQVNVSVLTSSDTDSQNAFVQPGVYLCDE